MGFNDHIDLELSARLDALIEQGYFEGASQAALGIAKVVSDGGLGVLSDKQRYVYETQVVPILEKGPPDEELL